MAFISLAERFGLFFGLVGIGIGIGAQTEDEKEGLVLFSCFLVVCIISALVIVGCLLAAIGGALFRILKLVCKCIDLSTAATHLVS